METGMLLEFVFNVYYRNQQIRSRSSTIVNAVSGSEIPVETDYDKTCPGAFNGDDEKNIVNRLSTRGLQIEQSRKARTRYGIQIADAVADVIVPMIKV
jgi:hypothetical protein